MTVEEKKTTFTMVNKVIPTMKKTGKLNIK